MKQIRKNSLRVSLTLAIVAVLGAYAYTAANTVDASFAGDGEGTVSGYEVSDIAYSSTDDQIDGVSFTLNEDASTVRAAINEGALVDCTETEGTWECPVEGGLEEATSLRVVAHQ